MLPTTEGDRHDLLSRTAVSAQRNGHAPPDPGGFLERYFQNVAMEDLADRRPEDLAGLALSHRSAALQRPQGTAVVRVFTPTEESVGWSTGHTVIEIVAADVPFLVDSVNGELARLDCQIHLVIHPQFVIRRDVTGAMVEVLDLPPRAGSHPALPRDAALESWIHVEIDRESDSSRLTTLEHSLRQVLEDVRVTVEDWPKMRAAAERIAAELRESPRSGWTPRMSPRVSSSWNGWRTATSPSSGCASTR